MTTPQEQRVKAGPMLGSRLEFFTVKTSLDIQPGTPLTTADLIAAAASVHNAQADTLGGTKTLTAVDFNEVQKDTAGQARLDYFVAAINTFAQPIMLSVIPTFGADTNGDTNGITFAFEHVGAADVDRLADAIADAIVVNKDAANLTAAKALITVTKQ
jgi:hypothetical protein